jgi:hypothetical protein
MCFHSTSSGADGAYLAECESSRDNLGGDAMAAGLILVDRKCICGVEDIYTVELSEMDIYQGKYRLMREGQCREIAWSDE